MHGELLFDVTSETCEKTKLCLIYTIIFICQIFLEILWNKKNDRNP